jgi:hypothetical protein
MPKIKHRNNETILALMYMESNKNKRNTKRTQNQTRNKKHEMQQKNNENMMPPRKKCEKYKRKH